MVKKEIKNETNIATTLKWISGGLEALLGIPLVGASIVIGLFYVPLLLMLAFHIVNFNISKKHGKKTSANVLGIVTNCVAWIPGVGMIMHILSAVFLMLEASRKE